MCGALVPCGALTGTTCNVFMRTACEILMRTVCEILMRTVCNVLVRTECDAFGPSVWGRRNVFNVPKRTRVCVSSPCTEGAMWRTCEVRVYSSYSRSYSRFFSWYCRWYSCSFLPTASMLSSFTTWSCGPHHHHHHHGTGIKTNDDEISSCTSASMRF